MADQHDKVKTKDLEDGVEEEVSHFKLTLTHLKHKGLERASSDIARKVKTLLADRVKLKCSGPGRMPTKHLMLVTRKSPCGNGTNTFDKWEMHIHKRVFHIHCSQKVFQSVISGILSEPGMILEAEDITEDDE